MNSSNSPASVVGQYFANSKREWHNLSHTLLASYASGFITPALCLPLTGNSSVVLNMEHALQTNPTVTPVFDSQRVNVRAFFYPQRLCTRGLYGNNYMELDEIESLEIPKLAQTINVSAVNPLTEVILPGSLLNRLGIPAMYLGLDFVPLNRRRLIMPESRYGQVKTTEALYPSDAATQGFSWNMSPVVGYYDICLHYLANPYDPEIPMASYSGQVVAGGGSVDTQFNDIYNLYDCRKWLLDMKGVASGVGSSTVPTQVSLLSKQSNINRQYITGGIKGPLGPLTLTLSNGGNGSVTYLDVIDSVERKSYQQGLFPSLYMDDDLTTYFDSDEIDKLMSVQLDSNLTAGNALTNVTVESVRLGKSIWNRMFRGILRGKKFDDWVQVQTGAKLKMSDHPIFVGADYFNVTFNDVLNNTAGTSEIPLGASASRGNKGSGNRRSISFTAQEPGYLFVLIDLVPYVSYSGNLPSWLDWKTFADFPLPAYAGRAFKDLKVSDVVFTDRNVTNNSVIGKQPLYYNFMTSHDRLGGIFETDLLDTYTFKRTFNFNWNGDLSDYESIDAQIIGSTYMQKGMYDYAFPDWGQNGGENFFIKTQFDLKVLQPIPRDVLKTRI